MNNTVEKAPSADNDIQDFLETLPRVPEYPIDGWKDVKVKESNEKLVPLGLFSDMSQIDTSGIYFGERGEGEEVNFVGKPVNRSISLITPFVREEVKERLRKAQALLPSGYLFKVFDTYRPLEVQQALFDTQRTNLKLTHPELTEEQLTAEAQRYVSIPSSDKGLNGKHPSPHSTGSAVDLTLVKISHQGSDSLHIINNILESGNTISEEVANMVTGNPKFYTQVMEYVENVKKDFDLSKSPKLQTLFSDSQKVLYYAIRAEIFRQESEEVDMGTQFDSFEPTAIPSFFEKLNDQGNLSDEQKEMLFNRRLLHYIMGLSGFTGYPEEWWHFSYGDNMNAIISGKNYAKYGTTELSEENILFESIRKTYYELRNRNASNQDTIYTSVKTEKPNRGRGYIK